MSMTKDEVGAVLEGITQLLELKGENPFKIRAYQNAARAIESYSGNLESAAREGRLREIPGIGQAIAEKIGELYATGRLAYYEELKAEFPAGIFEMFELMGLGPKKIRALYDRLGITSLEALEAACKDGRVAGLAGFGEKTAENILHSIEQRRSVAGSFLLSVALAAAETIYEDLRGHPDVSQVAIGGSTRRRKEVVHDLDFVVASKHPAAIASFFTTHPLVESVIMSGATKSSVRLKNGLQADLRVVTNAQYPFALNYFTGSKEHNIGLRSRALQHGWSLNEYRLSPVENGRVKPEPIPEIVQESDLYRALGLDFVEPELREDLGEFAAAEAHELPKLVELENLRGTFHCHTTASDGHASLEEMADAARELGLQYLGIADHSKSSFQAHGLDEARLLAQVEEIRRLNATFDDGFRLFAGVECDILKDGSLDFPDSVLSRLDYVVASVHSVFNLSEAEMTKRIVRAISNPNVTMLGHLTGRLLLSRSSYALDIPAVIDAAAKTGTLIELNGSPQRLDMDWRWWPLAKKKGVRCVINPDAHSTASFRYLWFGVAEARKGWLTRADVVNCLPLGKIEAVLAAKRKRLQH
ncbi:MAG: DNA polymerase/3'-5' exonuclease PolX [Chthoniobacteraceae bacterium]|nr:DNA polymerase/3'-5' exonuclease PolX [Chthoniobacteraceae bacterium]